MMIKKIFPLFFIISFLVSTPLSAQPGCDTVYVVVDALPRFGETAEELSTYLMKKLEFGECEINDMVVLTWTIDKTGRMVDIDAAGLEGSCRKNIIKQLEQFPNWIPGRLNGKPACV